MARSCSICGRVDAGAINALLGEGRSARSIAVELGLSEDAVQRHAQKHVASDRIIGIDTARPRRAAEMAADPLDELVNALRNQALAGNPAIVHQYRLALAAQADVHHANPPQRDLASEPQWIVLRSAMLQALEPYPAARQAIADALGGL